MSSSKNKWYNYFFYEGCFLIIFLMVLTLIASSYLGYLIPELLVKLSENYLKEELYYHAIKLFLYLYIATYITRAAYQVATNIYIRNIIDNVRNTIFVRWLLNYEIELGEDKKREYPQGEIIARIMSDGLALRELVTSGAFGIIFDFCFVASFLINFITLNKTTGIYLATIEIVFSFLLVFGGKYMREVYHQVRKSKGELSQTVANVVGGLEENYFIENHNYITKKGVHSFNDFLVKQMKANVWDASYYSIAESLYPLLLAFVVFIFPYSEIQQGAIILALVELIQRSINPIKSIAGKITNIQRAATGLHRISDLLSDLKKGHSSQIDRVALHLNLKRLCINIKEFTYNKVVKGNVRQEFRLHDIKFEGRKGELIGIVGLSGAGKSTLLNVMAGQIIPQHGEITLESQEGELLSIDKNKGLEDLLHYREQVGIVSQDSHIFTETLAFNISFSKEITNDLENFWAWISEKIPYLIKWGVSLDTLISPSTLSSGQNQLISAIRSCFLKKPVVLFDEISSALDSELELALREVVILIQRSSLTFIVAHRVETTMKANRILVLDDGTLINEGNHDELMSSSEKYQEFISQLSH